MFFLCCDFHVVHDMASLFLIFFFFKQKTAYEMRISDWSSDVCSSDLGVITLTLNPYESRQFNSQDIEFGNTAKGLEGSLGTGSGNWTLVIRTDLDIEPLAYIRTPDGFLTAMHDRVSGDGVDWLVPIFNPAQNPNQLSRLRVINPNLQAVDIQIQGREDRKSTR